MQKINTISLDGSELTWDDVDKRAKQLGMNRSTYTRFLYERDIEHKRFRDSKIVTVIFLLLMVMILLVVMLK